MPKRSTNKPHPKDVLEAFFANVEDKHNEPPYEYPEEAKKLMPVFLTCKMSMDQIEKIMPFSKRVIHVCAFLYPENVPVSLVEMFFPGEPQEKVVEAIKLLKGFSLLHDGFPGTVSMHKTHQYVLIENLKKDKLINPVLSYTALQSILILDKCVAEGIATKKELFKTYLVNIIKVVDNLKEIPMEEEHTILRVKLASHLKRFYTSTGIQCLKQAYQEARARLGMCGAECLKIRTMLADGLICGRQYEEAREVLDHTLNLKVMKYGEDHRETLYTQYQLGNLALQESPQFYSEEGLQLLQETYEKQKLLLGEEDKQTLKTQKLINLVIRNMERLNEQADAISVSGNSEVDKIVSV